MSRSGKRNIHLILTTCLGVRGGKKLATCVWASIEPCEEEMISLIGRGDCLAAAAVHKLSYLGNFRRERGCCCYLLHEFHVLAWHFEEVGVWRECVLFSAIKKVMPFEYDQNTTLCKDEGENEDAMKQPLKYKM